MDTSSMTCMDISSMTCMVWISPLSAVRKLKSHLIILRGRCDILFIILYKAHAKKSTIRHCAGEESSVAFQIISTAGTSRQGLDFQCIILSITAF